MSLYNHQFVFMFLLILSTDVGAIQCAADHLLYICLSSLSANSLPALS